jgi:hypothetical protein
MNATLKAARKFDEKCSQIAESAKPKVVRATG